MLARKRCALRFGMYLVSSCLLEPHRRNQHTDEKMDVEPKVYLHPQGLRPGMRHEGQFKPQRVLPNGRTLASLARAYTVESVDVLVSVITGAMADVKPSDRIKAAEILLDRGWGKATQVLQLEPSPATVVNLTRDQLRQIAAGALLPPIDGEASLVTGSLTAPPGEGDVS